MSEIVRRFYSPLEKAGLKKHIVSKAECDYLDCFSEFERLDLFDEEYDYNSRRAKSMFYSARIAGIILSLTGLSIITIHWVATIVLVVLSLIMFIVSIHLNDKLWVLQVQRGIFYGIKKKKVAEMF